MNFKLGDLICLNGEGEFKVTKTYSNELYDLVVVSSKYHTSGRLYIRQYLYAHSWQKIKSKTHSRTSIFK